MQKTAQKRGLVDKIWDKVNISGMAAERFFNSDFQKVMESIRQNDDDIRSIVSGETIGNGDPGDDPVSLKAVLKSAKSNLNKREYMSAVADLGTFHKKVGDVLDKIKTINSNVDAVHDDFLFKELDDNKKKILHNMKSKFSQQQNYEELIKKADLMDFFFNISKPRGRALIAWEKRYPGRVKELKQGANNLLNKSESLLGLILSELKNMSSARANRNVDNYMKAAGKINKGYDSYHALFAEFYKKHVLNFLNKMELAPPPEVKEVGKGESPVQVNIEQLDPEINKRPDVSNLPKTEDWVQTEPKAPLAFQPTMPSANEVERPVSLPNMSAPKVPELDTTPAPPPVHISDPPSGEFKSDQIAKELFGPKAAHQKFYQSLELMQGEDPIILAKFISKYADSIQNTDLDTAVKLFKIAKNIRG